MMMIVTICFILLIFPDASQSLTEDEGSECDSNSECLPSTECQYYQGQQDILKNLTSRASKTKLILKLRKLICNKNQRGICCPKYIPESELECGKPQLAASSVSFSFYCCNNFFLNM